MADKQRDLGRWATKFASRSLLVSVSELQARQLRNESAIHFATQLVVFNITSLQYFSEVNGAAGNENTFGIHPLILKYKRIYDWDARTLRAELGTERGTVHQVASQLGFGVESVRLWVKQADVDAGVAPGVVSTTEARRVRELEPVSP